MSRPLSELISSDAQDALAGANAPGASNVFVTADDIASLAPPLDPNIQQALETANGPSDFNPYATINDLPTPESFPQLPKNIYIDPPTAPHAFDDEFRGGSADVASRGWTFVNDSLQPMVRVGEVEYGVAFISGAEPGGGLADNQYRSSLFESHLTIQMPAGVSALMYKAQTGAALYAMRAKSSFSVPAQVLAMCAVRDDPSTKSFIASNNRHGWSGIDSNGGFNARGNIQGDAYGSASVAIDRDYPADLYMLRLGGSGTYEVLAIQVDTLRQVGLVRLSPSASLNGYGYAGLYMKGASQTYGTGSWGAGVSIFQIDYIRRMNVDGSPWFGAY